MYSEIPQIPTKSFFLPLSRPTFLVNWEMQIWQKERNPFLLHIRLCDTFFPRDGSIKRTSYEVE